MTNASSQQETNAPPAPHSAESWTASCMILGHIWPSARAMHFPRALFCKAFLLLSVRHCHGDSRKGWSTVYLTPSPPWLGTWSLKAEATTGNKVCHFACLAPARECVGPGFGAMLPLSTRKEPHGATSAATAPKGEPWHRDRHSRHLDSNSKYSP